jgi:hypothetical protein
MIDFENPTPDLSTNILYDIRLQHQESLANYTNAYYTMHFRLHRVVYDRYLGESLSILRAAFVEFLYVLRSRGDIQPNTRIGMVLYADRVNFDTEAVIGVSERPFAAFTVEHILEAITNALNSAQNFRFQFQIKLNITRIPNIQGTDAFHDQAYETFAVKNRAIHRIDNEGDCAWIWLGLNITFYMLRGFQGDWRTVWDAGECKRIWKNPKRFYTSLAHQVRLEARSIPQEISLDSLTEISRLWNIRFQVFQWNVEPSKHQLSLLQLVLDTEVVSSVTFYGILTRGTQGSHIDFLQSPNRVWKGVVFCEVCKLFQKKKALCKTKDCGSSGICVYCHSCSTNCVSCNQETCVSTARLDTPQKCTHCMQLLSYQGCVEFHRTCDVQLRRCKQCKFLFHGSRPCFSKKCVGCWKYISARELETHECFIQPIALQEPKDAFMVYDFECALDENQRHVPYLVTAWFPNGYPGLDALKSHFATCVWPVPRMSGEEIFVFWGLSSMGSRSVVRFFDLIEALKDVDCFAHNSKSYDGIFIKANLMERGIVTEDIKRGAKYLQISLPEQNVHFKDSVSFMPCSLRSLSDDFGIEELVKGHFPHSLMTTQFLEELNTQGYKIAKPTLAAFDFDFGITKKAIRFRQEALEWYQTWYRQETNAWDIREACIQYCISDTVLLGLSLQKFRLEFLQLTEAIERPSYIEKHQHLDPLRYVTLPSAIMKFYLSQCLPQNAIGILDRTDSEIYANVVEYEIYLESTHEHVTQVELEDGDLLKGLVFQVGAIQHIFLPCYMTGCGSCFQLLELQSRLEVSFHTLQKITEHNLRRFGDAHVMKECAWLQLRKTEAVTNILYAKRLAMMKRKPMRFRDAYKGGFVETYCAAYYGELSYVDFVSQYPATMLGETMDPLHPSETLEWKLPVGTPIHLKQPVFSDLREQYATGIAKVAILPPQHLMFPFLSMKVFAKKLGEEGTFEILYGLCRTCMEIRSKVCSHTEEERYLIGTWTMSELTYAESIG